MSQQMQTALSVRRQGSLFMRAPCMGNNLAEEVRYALGSRER